MDNQQHPIVGAVTSCISLMSALFAVITIEQVQAYLTLSASSIAILSGTFAIRYYWYATRKIKK